MALVRAHSSPCGVSKWGQCHWDNLSTPIHRLRCVSVIPRMSTLIFMPKSMLQVKTGEAWGYCKSIEFDLEPSSWRKSDIRSSGLLGTLGWWLQTFGDLRVGRILYKWRCLRKLGSVKCEK